MAATKPNKKGAEMKEVWGQCSTNGRWGMAIVAAEEVKFPARGSVRKIGVVSGTTTYLFEPSDKDQWVAVFEREVRIHGGAVEIEGMGLQSGQASSIVLMGPEAVIEIYGYKRRSSSIVAFHNGVRRDISPTVLLAMGLLPARATKEPWQAPEVPELQGAMASAFSKIKGA